jgi:hypothetical protein
MDTGFRAEAMSFQTALHNRTPFSVAKFVLPDRDGQEIVLVVVAATFEAGPGGNLQLADAQQPVRPADVHRGDPATSSVRYEADIALVKPFVDVLINGSAFAPGGRPVPSVSVEISIGDLRKELVVSGDRFWRAGPFGATVSSPKPFVTLPIVFERAFGGADDRVADQTRIVVEARNPVGVGLNGVRSRDPSVESELPNVEAPSARMVSKSDRPAPAGFSAVGRGWLPRISYAGTYDSDWLAQRWPLLPADFDDRFNQCAPADQQTRMLRGGEPVRLLNMTPNGNWTFQLPSVNVPVTAIYDGRDAALELKLDTVMIEPDARQVTLTSRVAIATVRNRGLLRELAVGHVSRGWLRSRTQAKRFADAAGTGGVLSHQSNYEL